MATYTQSLQRRRQMALAVLLVALGALLAFTGPGPFGAPASALAPSNGGVSMSSINDYANYPAFGFAQGCDRTNTLVNDQYSMSVNGGPPSTPVGTLDALGEIPFGATVIMTWDSWAPGCATDISLSVKKAEFGTFNYLDNQELISYVGCNGNGAGCTVQGGFRLTLTMPTQAVGGCHYQVDAVVGAPLDIVGPNGSYYNPNYRQAFPNSMNEGGVNTLIGFNNGRAVCEPLVTTTTVEETTTTVEETTTTVGETTTTLATTTTTDDPGTTTTATVLSTTLTQPGSSTTGATVAGVTVTRPGSGTLARTGNEGDGTRTLLAAGMVLAGLGVALFGHDRKLGWLHRS